MLAYDAVHRVRIAPVAFRFTGGDRAPPHSSIDLKSDEFHLGTLAKRDRIQVMKENLCQRKIDFYCLYSRGNP
jgi:hypothetical protein